MKTDLSMWQHQHPKLELESHYCQIKIKSEIEVGCGEIDLSGFDLSAILLPHQKTCLRKKFVMVLPC